MISVIVPVRDVAATLPDQLDVLARQSYPGPWELLVVDNGSTDATVAIARDARARLPQLRVVDAGPVRACRARANAGHRRGHRRLPPCSPTVTTSSPTTGSQHMADAAATCDFVAGVVDRTRFTYRPSADPARARSSARIPFPGFLPFAMGANFGVRARVVAEVGGFDETYAGGGEDPDFSWRVQLAGHELCEADAVTHYRERAAPARPGAAVLPLRRERSAPVPRLPRPRDGTARRTRRGACDGRTSWCARPGTGRTRPGAASGCGRWRDASGRLAGSARYRVRYC